MVFVPSADWLLKERFPCRMGNMLNVCCTCKVYWNVPPCKRWQFVEASYRDKHLSYLINSLNLACIVNSASSRGLHGSVSRIFTRSMIASRRVTATVALQQTPTMVMNMRELVAKSSMLSTIKTMSMNWVSIRKYRGTIVTKVNALYNTLAPVDDHSMGRHTPPTLYMRKFRGSIRISGIRKWLIETSQEDTSALRRVSTKITPTARLLRA